MMKVDLCMWAKNGEEFLPIVLRRIDKVIPQEVVNKRIFVDDHSTDRSVEIARDFGWNVYKNKEGFVAGGAREALRHVESEFFISVEQDVLLSRDWWDKIPKYMDNQKVVVAQGIRIPTNPTMRIIYEYSLERFKKKAWQSLTFDNNIFRTRIVKKLGGFPKEYPISVDLAFAYIAMKAGYRWVTDTNVVSDHIRKKFLGEMKHREKLLLLSKRKQELDEASFKNILRRFLTSPLRSAHITYKKHYPISFFAYPVERLFSITMFVKRRAYWNRMPKCWRESESKKRNEFRQLLAKDVYLLI